MSTSKLTILGATVAILVIGGFLHETYQEIKGRRIPFDERKIIQEELGQ